MLHNLLSEFLNHFFFSDTILGLSFLLQARAYSNCVEKINTSQPSNYYHFALRFISTRFSNISIAKDFDTSYFFLIVSQIAFMYFERNVDSYSFPFVLLLVLIFSITMDLCSGPAHVERFRSSFSYSFDF